MTKRLRSIYHGYVQIAEIDATDETAPFVTKTFRWDSSEPVATRPLVMSLWTRERSVRETLYYAHDLRKNVVSLFDGKGLRRVSYEYDPFGNITSMDGDMAEENPFRFSSEYHDENLGLVYYNYRHYNPTDGRWISRDSIAEQGGWNLYGLVANNAISSVDILGTRIAIARTPFHAEQDENVYSQLIGQKFTSANSLKNDTADYKKFTENIRRSLQKLLGKNCGTLRLVEREVDFPLYHINGIFAMNIRSKVWDLSLDPPSDPDKCKNASRCIYNAMRDMIDGDLEYSIARVYNITRNAMASRKDLRGYISPSAYGRHINVPYISANVSNPHTVPFQETFKPTPIPVVLWHELGGYLYLDLPHEKIECNFRPAWRQLVSSLCAEGKAEEAMAKYGPFGTKIDRVQYAENIASQALIENGYYPVELQGLWRNPAYYVEEPTAAQRRAFNQKSQQTRQENKK